MIKKLLSFVWPGNTRFINFGSPWLEVNENLVTLKINHKSTTAE